MAEYIRFLDPHSTAMTEKLQSLPKVSGSCIFIDMVNSTGIKYAEGIEHWGKLINNTFNMFNLLNNFPNNIVKGIGDEIMLFVPDDELRSRSQINDYYSLLFELYATVDNIKNFPIDGLFSPCKVGIHYCTEAYNITFFRDMNDYYGRDIDMAARVMSQSKANHIVMSDAFYQRVQADVAQNAAYANHELLQKIGPAAYCDFRGVPQKTAIRLIEV